MDVLKHSNQQVKLTWNPEALSLIIAYKFILHEPILSREPNNGQKANSLKDDKNSNPDLIHLDNSEQIKRFN